MNPKKLKIFGTILAFLLTFLCHFIYDKLPCFFTAIFFPVNESIWEHMKILFDAIIISGVTQKIIVKSKKLGYKNVCISNFTAALSSIPIFLIMYLPAYYAFGEHLWLTIIILFIAIILAEVLAYKIMMIKKDLKLENMAILFVIIIYTFFGMLTFFPPHQSLFYDTKNKYYGIKKAV